jgi:hypothetical protein
MEILQIKGDTVFLLYHASDAAEVGEQFEILEISDNPRGIIVQVISNDSHEYPGIEQELIQRILEERITPTQRPLDKEAGLGEIRNLKVAKAKIRKRIENGKWQPWNGWIPTRNVTITPVSPQDLIQHVLPLAGHPLSFLQYRGEPVQIDGPRLDMVNVITGVKGSGKSHLAKHFVISLSSIGVPCVVFDINGEYSVLPNAQNLRWGETFIPDLAQLGYEILLEVVQSLNPLPETSRAQFEYDLPRFYSTRRQYCQNRGIPFSIDIAFLRQQTWGGGSYVQQAIDRRLEMVENRNLFFNQSHQARGLQPSNFNEIYDNACNNQPIIFDLQRLSIQMRSALARAIINLLERICEQEGAGKGQQRFPYVFFEEAHLYISETAIMNIITRGRHIGIASVFITNSPQKLPDTVFRQLDNLFLQTLTHKDDIRSVSKNSFTDEDTIESFATRMPPRHALIIGAVTDRYPIIAEVDPLPSGVPPTGETRSTWRRLQS